MTIAVMQPYFFPYLGYFQLVKAVDRFVFFDDVNFIKKGWIHRNQVLLQGAGHLFSIPLAKASQNRKIREIELADFAKWREDFLRLIEHSYKKAPHYPEVYAWLSGFLHAKTYETISELAIGSVRETMDYLGIEKAFLKSSELPYRKEDGTPAQDKIFSICGLLDADTYINPKNGIDLYDKQAFTDRNMRLFFINMKPVSYPQLKKDGFVPYLSMLDVLMFNTPAEARQMLDAYELQ
jgi:hypothetical protein